MLIPRVTELTRAGRPFVALASLPSAPQRVRPTGTPTAAARGAAPLRSRQLSRA